MKKPILFLVCLYLTAIAYSQDNHVEGRQMIDISFGKTRIGTLASAAFLKNVSDNVYLKLRGFAEFGSIYNLKYSQYNIDIMAYAKPFKITDYIQLNIGAGATTGYATINGVSDANKKNIGFQAGIKGGFDLEALASDHLSFFTFANQAYMLKKSIGNKYYELGIGIRIFLNNYE